MGDPGLAFLYDQRPRNHQHLPRELASTSSSNWGACIGNVENAKLALSALQGLIADAVVLDEEAYTNAATLQLYQQRLQV